jgi:hypothetical protein
MSSLSMSNPFDITQSDDAPDSGNCHLDYIQVQPEFMGAAPSWEYGGARSAPHISQA